MQPQALALSRPAHRSQAAHSLSFVAGERTRDRQFSGPAARVFAPNRRHRLLDLRTGAAARRCCRLFFLLHRNRDFARRSQRRHLRSCCLAGSLGYLTPRVFLLAPLRLLFGSLARLLFGSAARLFLFDLSARFFLGPLARLANGAFFLLAASISFGESGQPPRFLVGLEGILHGAGAARPFLSGQRAGNYDRAARRLCRCRPRRRLLARGRRRCLGATGLGQPRGDHAFLAHLDGDGLRASVREALPHLRRLGGFAKLQPAAAAAERQRPLLLLFRRVLLLLVRVAHLVPIPSSCRTRRDAAGSAPRSTTAPERKPAIFSASASNRRLSRPPPSATFTT
jgi:hypothetical protein